jgi:hypothetical protein
MSSNTAFYTNNPLYPSLLASDDSSSFIHLANPEKKDNSGNHMVRIGITPDLKFSYCAKSGFMVFLTRSFEHHSLGLTVQVLFDSLSMASFVAERITKVSLSRRVLISLM